MVENGLPADASWHFDDFVTRLFVFSIVGYIGDET